MKQTPRRTASQIRFVLAAVLAVLAVWASPAAADGPAPTKPAARFEVKYLTQTIDHHFMAVQMAELCPGRAEHQPLLDLCAQIAADQTGEIELMHGWLADWYAVEKEPEMKPGDENMLRKLAALSGPAFEVSFMKMMVRHHQRAVRDGAQCRRMAYHPELHGFCAHVIEEQSREIAMMQSWLCIWYDVCK
jgi:uncharacterized protein (DUF305 family)